MRQRGSAATCVNCTLQHTAVSQSVHHSWPVQVQRCIDSIGCVLQSHHKALHGHTTHWSECYCNAASTARSQAFSVPHRTHYALLPVPNCPDVSWYGSKESPEASKSQKGMQASLEQSPYTVDPAWYIHVLALHHRADEQRQQHILQNAAWLTHKQPPALQESRKCSLAQQQHNPHSCSLIKIT